jgi:hypothetical protein
VLAARFGLSANIAILRKAWQSILRTRTGSGPAEVQILETVLVAVRKTGT